MTQLSRLTVRAKVVNCEACALRKTARAPIPWRGSNSPTVAVIGEAPGKYENVAGRPFVGPSGQLVERWLSGCGFDLDAVAYLNTVSCFPNRTPTAAEVAACSDNLSAQLAFLQPRWCVVFGGVATGRWFPGIRMGDIRGRYFTIDTGPGLSTGENVPDDKGTIRAGDTWCMATWHPAAVLRNGALEADVIADLRGLRRNILTNGRDPLSEDKGSMGHPFDYRCILCSTYADRWLGSNGKESLDGRGGIGYCQKHWDTRQGVAGQGRAKAAKKTSAGAKKAGAKVAPQSVAKAKNVPLNGGLL